jgi:hypothetical protein
MRSSLALALMLAAATACGTDPAIGGDDTGGGDDGTGSGSNVDPGDPAPPARGFQLKSPEITINPYEEVTYCWYFKTPNTEQYSIKKWTSHMSGGSHHLILFFTNSLSQPEGTVSADNCGFGGVGNVGQWVYAAQNIDQELALPSDDGTGKPLGMDVKAGQTGFLQLHYYNSGEETLHVHAVINAEAHEANVDATKTFAYVTFNGNIDIPAGAVYPQPGTVATNTCDIPSGSKVWLMSTHAHKHAIHTEVRNGSEVVFESDDWEHPGAKAWMSSPFYSFSTGKLTYECHYNNPDGPRIQTGDSAAKDEMCMASGYIFPATKTTICYNNLVF